MDFLQPPQVIKHYRLKLVVWFGLALGFSTFCINLLVGIFGLAFGLHGSLLLHEYTVPIVCLLLLVIVGGSLAEAYRLRRGGHVLAKRLGARRLQFNSSVPEEQMLHEVVQELSRRSGIAAPTLYILDDELGLNALVAGHKSQDMVLMVTWGLLQTLDRHEMQGVVGHEFGHIRNGDAQLNFALVAWVAGLLLVSQIGSWIAHTGFSLQREVQRPRRADALFVVLGGMIWLLGSLGVLVARFVKLAVLSQREFLADHASLQYTQSHGVLQALLRIRAHPMGTQLHGVYTESISHFCFGEALHRHTWISPQPPLDVRIYQLSPDALQRAMLQEQVIQAQHTERVKALNPPLTERIMPGFAWRGVPRVFEQQAIRDWQVPLPLPVVRLQPLTCNVKDAVNPLNPAYRQNVPHADIIQRALSTPTGCRELLAAILILRQALPEGNDSFEVSLAIMQALQRMDHRLPVSIFLQAVEGLGNLPASASRQLLTRLSDIIQHDGQIGLLDVLLLEKVKVRLHLLPQVTPVVMEKCTYPMVILVEALLHIRQLPRVQQARVRRGILQTILSPGQFNQVVNHIVTRQPVNLAQALYQLSGLLKRERMSILAAVESCLWADAAISQEEQDVLDLLYWRFGFEANLFADYTNRKIAMVP